MDLSRLPVCSDYSTYDIVEFDGGEPMLSPSVMKYAIEIIRLSNQRAKLIMHTSYNRDPMDILHKLDYLDGVVITLHEQEDVEPFLKLAELLHNTGRLDKEHSKTLKVNVLNGVEIDGIQEEWVVQSSSEWEARFTLDKNEEFMRFCDEQDLYLIS